MSADDMEIVRRALAALAARDIDRSLYHADVELINAPGSPFNNAAGLRGFRDWTREVDEAFEEWDFRPSEVRDAPGDKILVVNRAWGRGKNTGMEVEMDLHLVYTVTGGKIARVEGYYTLEEALEAAGLSE